jgi:predicted ATPase
VVVRGGRNRAAERRDEWLHHRSFGSDRARDDHQFVPVAMLNVLAVAGYRSLRDCVVPLAALNVVTGANGSGKSNLYRAVRLLADIAQGRIIAHLAREGGLPSVLWAGPESYSRAVRRGEHPVQGTLRGHAVRLLLGFAAENFGYAIDLGLPAPSRPAFAFDPEIKREWVWNAPTLRPSSILVERRGPVVTTHNAAGEHEVLARGIAAFDSMMTFCADARGTPELLALRESIRQWRFYDHFRTDAEAPARRAQIGTHTPVLNHDGADLAAALQTIREVGDGAALDTAIGDAFPGSRIEISIHDGRFEVVMHQHGLLRPLRAAELSDGTLRYLLWTAALLTPRPPELMVLNEPETSLGRLIAVAAGQMQIFVVSHAARLIAALEDGANCRFLMLAKDLGETRITNLDPEEIPAWHWPAR